MRWRIAAGRTGGAIAPFTCGRYDVFVGAFGLALLVAGCGDADFEWASTREATGTCESAETVRELPGVIREASGVTRDPRDADVFWVHNDSGNPAELFAIDATGRLLGVVPLVDATSRDLEDIAAGPCGSESCLYLADIGDNLAVYSSVYVHRLPLPALPEAGEGNVQDGSPGASVLAPVRPEASWRLVYPGGARDAESLAIDGDAGVLVLVTKGREGLVELYTAKLSGLRPGSEVPDTLRRVGRLPLPIGQSTGQFITGADLSPDGTRLAVRSYTTLYEFGWSGPASFDTLTAPVHSPLVGAWEAQGEGVAWDDTGESLMLVSEGRGGRPPVVSRIRCPAPEEAAPADRTPAQDAPAGQTPGTE